MAVGLKIPDQLLPVKGVKTAAIASGIKPGNTDDLALISLGSKSTVSATFTQNKFRAAPIIVAEENLSKAKTRALLINSGNANAGTGQQGIKDAKASCKAAAHSLEIKTEEVLPFSTGVIGEYLPVELIEKGMGELRKQLHEENWLKAATAIMTTDTLPKAVSHQIELGGELITITGIAKGAGMICPDMATMLAFIATDATVNRGFLDEILRVAVEKSFNRITIDGDTSTNDACILIATGESSCAELTNDSNDIDLFTETINKICMQLAQSIIRDGEGATKFVTVDVQGAKNDEESLAVAYAVAHSPLVKTALFASDPNWGRILAAVGRSDIDDLDISRVDILLNEVCIIRNGERDIDYTEEKGQAVMNNEEISIHIFLNRGSTSNRIWTTDLSYDYVKINSEYRT